VVDLGLHALHFISGLAYNPFVAMQLPILSPLIDAIAGERDDANTSASYGCMLVRKEIIA